jgi:hypothetical protein
VFLSRVDKAWTLIGSKLQLPKEPPQLQRHINACNHHAQLIHRHRIDADEPWPETPAAVIRYEIKINDLAKQFSNLAKKFGCYWDDNFLVGEKEKLLSKTVVKRDSKKTRKKVFRGTKVSKHNSLVGDQFIFEDDEPSIITPKEARDRLSNFLSKLGRSLVFVEDLQVKNQSRAEFERQNESAEHHRLVSEMVGILRRQGFSVYPGGVPAVVASVAPPSVKIRVTTTEPKQVLSCCVYLITTFACEVKRAKQFAPPTPPVKLLR